MDKLVKHFTVWCNEQPDIRAGLLVGSQARSDNPADEWSDLDLIVIAENPQVYLASTDWLSSFGSVWLTFLEPTAVGGLVERRVLFDGARDVDFVFVPLSLVQQMVDSELPPEVADLFRRGVRVLVDKDGMAAQLTRAIPSAPAPRPPGEAEFIELVHDFLYHAVWTAKKLRRGEVWTAKACCDGYMKRRLLHMIEWHARAHKGWETNVWYDGRFLEEWAEPRAVEGLRHAFAYYDATDVRRALFASLALFRALAQETAGHLGFLYPEDADARVTAWLEAHV